MKKCIFAVLFLLAAVSQTIAAAPEKWSETTRDVAVVADSAIYKIPFDTFYSQTMIGKAPKSKIHQYTDTILLIPEPSKSIGTKNVFFIVTDSSVKAADLTAEIKLVGSSATDPLKTIKNFKLFANNKEYRGVKELMTYVCTFSKKAETKKMTCFTGGNNGSIGGVSLQQGSGPFEPCSEADMIDYELPGNIKICGYDTDKK